jgi:hypothetical protein
VSTSGQQLTMERQTVEVTFQGEWIGSHTEKDTTCTLYSVADDLYVVHVDKGDESWLETNGGQGLSGQMLGTFFPQLAEDFVGERVFPHKFR